MNLRGIANALTSAVNPNVVASLRVCTGYGQGSNYRATPSYAAPVPAAVNLQALTKREVEHLYSLNISNAEWGCYCDHALTPVDRVTQSGGDLLDFTDPDTGTPTTWLVVAKLEGWGVWNKVALVKQRA